MIEYRAILRKDKRFEGGYRLSKGTVIYVREMGDWWMGTHYEEKGSAHSFNLEEDDFSVLESADCQVTELVVMPDPPDPPEKIQRERDLARRRLERQIERHRETANELEKLLTKTAGGWPRSRAATSD